LYSGDVGKLTEDGHLKITDRKKDIIITSGGKNISPQEIENEFKASPYIKDAVVIGDGRKYLTALILIEYDNVGKWAEDNHIAYTTFKDLSQKQEVFELVSQITKEVNKKYAQVETIKKFTVLDKELDQDDDELTATQKVRRKIIEEKYKDVITKMYK
jgi:long-chain acyl-CoA synthetase